MDLLETDEGLSERRKEIFKASKLTTPDRRKKIEKDYEQKLDDDCLHFFCNILIPNYFSQKILEQIDRLKPFCKDIFNRETFGVTEPIEQLKILKNILQDTLPIDISKEENYCSIIQHYSNLIDVTKIVTTTDMVAQWLELDNFKNSAEKVKIEHECTETLKLITLAEFEKYTEPSKSKKNQRRCSNEKFLKEFGIKRNSNEHKEVCDKYFNGKSFSKSPSAIIQGKTYKVRSVCHSKNNDTFYFLVSDE